VTIPRPARAVKARLLGARTAAVTARRLPHHVHRVGIAWFGWWFHFTRAERRNPGPVPRRRPAPPDATFPGPPASCMPPWAKQGRNARRRPRASSRAAGTGPCFVIVKRIGLAGDRLPGRPAGQARPGPLFRRRRRENFLQKKFLQET